MRDAIRSSGFNVGMARVRDVGRGETAFQIDATCTTTGRVWIVSAPTEYAATVELALQVGFDLEE